MVAGLGEGNAAVVMQEPVIGRTCQSGIMAAIG